LPDKLLRIQRPPGLKQDAGFIAVLDNGLTSAGVSGKNNCRRGIVVYPKASLLPQIWQ
jgi:hypothetical protein